MDCFWVMKRITRKKGGVLFKLNEFYMTRNIKSTDHGVFAMQVTACSSFFGVPFFEIADVLYKQEFATLLFCPLSLLYIKIKIATVTHVSPLSFSIFFASGTGSQILFYDLHTGNMIKSFQVFEGIRVHGISCTVMSCTEGTCISKLDFKIAVFGERRVKLFSLHIDIASNMQNQAQVSVDLILHQSLPKFNHWVLDVCFLEVHNSHAHSIPVLLYVFIFVYLFHT